MKHIFLSSTLSFLFSYSALSMESHGITNSDLAIDLVANFKKTVMGCANRDEQVNRLKTMFISIRIEIEKSSRYPLEDLLISQSMLHKIDSKIIEALDEIVDAPLSTKELTKCFEQCQQFLYEKS